MTQSKYHIQPDGYDVRATVEMAGEINPPLVYEPCSEDIPPREVYGDLEPTTEVLSRKDLRDLILNWVSKFSKTIEEIGNAPNESNLNELDNLFAPHLFWKDHLSFTWDFHQYNGLLNVKEILRRQLPSFRLTNFQINQIREMVYKDNYSIVTLNEDKADEGPIIQYVQVIVNFENQYGKGNGVIRLIPASNKLVAYSVYTGLESISGNEETIGPNRARGVNHGQHKDRISWLENRKKDFIWGENSKGPTVLIVGGGHSGLNIAARLKVMGVDSLIVEKNKNIGDNWRKRYKFLVLHDPVWQDHLAYLNFPDTWPIYTPKDKLGDWFEYYANILELSYWTNKTVSGAEFNDNESVWSVDIIDNDSGRYTKIRPKHIIMATGHSGEPNIPVFEDQHKFKGQIVHSSQHTTGKMYQGENALVVGCCNSGHDIAHDFYEQGANPTIVQRSSTCIFTSEIGGSITGKGVYEEGGPPTETADLISVSMRGSY